MKDDDPILLFVNQIDRKVSWIGDALVVAEQIP